LAIGTQVTIAIGILLGVFDADQGFQALTNPRQADPVNERRKGLADEAFGLIEAQGLFDGLGDAVSRDFDDTRPELGGGRDAAELKDVMRGGLAGDLLGDVGLR